MGKRRWYDFARMSHGEYRANLAGLNIFFGAVLGFVMAGTEALDALQFARLLAVVSALVIGILYITSSKYRLLYAALMVGLVYFLPHVADSVVGEGTLLPEKLQPTLAVWVAMTIVVEFLPRERPATTAAANQDAG